MHVLFVALGTGRKRQVLEEIDLVRDHGGRASLIVLKRSQWPELSSGDVEVAELAELEASLAFHRAERLVVLRAPRRILRLLLRLLGVLRQRSPGPLARGIGAVEQRVERLERWHHRAGRRFHEERYAKAYKNVRPLALWRVARRDVLPELDLSDLDAVVVADSLSTPIGWHLARARPDLPVGFSLDRELLAGDGPPGGRSAG